MSLEITRGLQAVDAMEVQVVIDNVTHRKRRGKLLLPNRVNKKR